MAELKKYRYEYDEWEDFGNRVRQYRKSLGLTVEQLAEMTNRSENYINRLEKGEKTCSIHTIHQLHEALRVSVDDLLYGNYIKEKEYLDKEIIQTIINKANNKELKVMKNLILDVFPEFTNLIK